MPRNTANIMLLYLIIHNIFVSDVYFKDISNMKYHLHHLNLGQYYIQQQHDQNFQHIY